jgi:glycosyltransferase involved in cell wall biosynthesis
MNSTAGRRSPLKVLTNAHWLAGREAAGHPIEIQSLPSESSPLQRLRLLALWRYDAVFLNIEAGWLYLACAAKKLLPFVQCRILSVDVILTRPQGLAERIRFFLRRWLLKEVDRFVLYFRDTAELQRVYSIPSDRVRYVPFKTNTLEEVLATPSTDEGFFLACGRSNRDYATLCEAMRDLPYQCYILAPWGAIEEHGTHFDGTACPPNVTLVSDDGTPDSWNRWIARARGIILPIDPGNLSPSGIGTYLVAMALGKCVIITRSPATEHILTEELAVLVPARDAGALGEAVVRVAEDAAYRERIAEAGRRYALALGGEERLREDLVRELADVAGYPQGGVVPAGCAPTAVSGR